MYSVIGNINKRVNSLALKESPLEFDDTELRALMATNWSENDAKIAALTVRVARLEGLVGSLTSVLQQLANGGTLVLGNNVLLDDGAA
jgi:ABC-type bacteriocin/lantibiotic exporter with double-glycine peptidase domain